MKLFNRNPSSRNEDPRALFRDTVDAGEERLYINVLALRLLVEKKQREIVEFVRNRYDVGDRMIWESNLDIAVSNTAGRITSFTTSRSSPAYEYAIAKQTLDVLEASPEFVAAQQKLEPLIASIEQSDKEKNARVVRVGAAAAKLANLEEKAREKATAAIDEDPNVLQARRELAEAEAAAAN